MRKFKCVGYKQNYEKNFTVGKIYYGEDGSGIKCDDGFVYDYYKSIDEVIDFLSGYYEFEEVFDEEIKEDKKVGKFKVGDKVRVLNNRDGHLFKIGEVVEIECDKVQESMRCKGKDKSYWLSFENIELVYRKNNQPKTFTITTSDTTTTLTDGTHTTSISRYYTDKHDDMIALEEVVKKYKSEIDEMERKSKEMHLMMGKDDYGVIGTLTVLVDSIGRKLSIGDVVKVYDKNGEYVGTEFVCSCSPYGDFIMGCASSTMNNSKKKFNYLKEFSYEETVEKSLSFSGLEVIK